jgi:ubiquinone biosynthesis protein
VLNQFDAMTRDGLVLSPETVEAIGKAEAKRNRWQTLALGHRPDVSRILWSIRQ